MKTQSWKSSRVARLLLTLLAIALLASACSRDDSTSTAADEPAAESSEEESEDEEEAMEDEDEEEAMEDEDEEEAMEDEEEAMEDEDDGGSDADQFVVDAESFVTAQLAATEGFDGPADGPVALEDISIIYVASDLTNGGVAAVDQSAAEAAEAIGWEYETLNGQGTTDGRAAALNQAIAQGPDGIILGGFDVTEQQTSIAEAEAQGIPIVGWHAAADVGPAPGLFNNVTTDPLEVSRFAAQLAVAESGGTAGAVIFTDSQFEIAIAKADAIADELSLCAGCTVLETVDTPITDTAAQTPAVISRILAEYGDDLTHILTINDGYFGGAAPALRDAGIDPAGSPFGISAGDGDAAAFDRIRNSDFQFGTVAEPLFLQGWQIIDELNRALSGEGPSDFVAPPALVTGENVTGDDVFDPASGYRENYQAIWAG